MGALGGCGGRWGVTTFQQRRLGSLALSIINLSWQSGAISRHSDRVEGGLESRRS